MKRSLALLVVILFIPPITAYAASCTSRSFVVRNWKATPASTTPDTITPLSTEEIETGELEGEEPTIPPDDDQTIPPASTTPPTSTDEVEQGEQSEQGDEEELEDLTRGQIEPDEDIGAVPAAPASTDEVDMSVEPEGEEQAGVELEAQFIS